LLISALRTARVMSPRIPTGFPERPSRRLAVGAATPIAWAVRRRAREIAAPAGEVSLLTESWDCIKGFVTPALVVQE